MYQTELVRKTIEEELKEQMPKRKGQIVELVSELSDKQFEWRNHPSIYKFTRQNGLLTPGQHAEWLRHIERDRTIQMFGLRSNGAAVGTAGLTNISIQHGTAEFSLLIAPNFHRQGYGRAALIALLRYGFNHMRLHCIWGETFTTNPAFEMFKKLGFIEEGRVRQRYFKEGEYQDAFIVSMLRSEFMEKEWK